MLMRRLADFAAVAFPTFSMSLASNRGAAAVGEDGMTVALLISSLLPCVRTSSITSSERTLTNLRPRRRSRSTRCGSSSRRQRGSQSGSPREAAPSPRASPLSRSSVRCALQPSRRLEPALTPSSADLDERPTRARALANPLLAHHLPVLPPTRLGSQPCTRSAEPPPGRREAARDLLPEGPAGYERLHRAASCQ